MIDDFDTSSARVAFDLGLQSNPSELFDRLVYALLKHEHALEGIVLEDSDLQRALLMRPVRTQTEADIFRSVRNLRDNLEYSFRIAYPTLDLEYSQVATHDHVIADVLENEKHVSILTREFCEQVARLQSTTAGRTEEALVSKEKIPLRMRPLSPGVYYLSVIPPEEIDAALDELYSEYAQECERLDPIESAAKFHWRFMEIFPYDRTTGLIARVLLQAHLVWAHIPPAIIVHTQRPHYFSALGHSWEALLEVVVAGVQHSEHVCRKVLGI